MRNNSKGSKLNYFALGLLAIVLAGCEYPQKTQPPTSTSPDTNQTTVTGNQNSCTPNSQRTCQAANGTGSQTCDSIGKSYSSCVVQQCNAGFSLQSNFCVAVPGVKNCSFNGQTILNGQSVTAYSGSIASFGGSCSAQTRTCQNGQLSGDASYQFSSCQVSTDASAWAASEANDLLLRTFNKFWNPNTLTFEAPVPNADSCSGNQACFWPTVATFKALAEAELRKPGMFTSQLYSAYSAMQLYFNTSLHAFVPSHYVAGNNQPYYDDNGLAIISLVRAFEATNDIQFLRQAYNIEWQFMYPGYNAGFSYGRGSMQWNYDMSVANGSDLAACSSLAAAVAALSLATQANTSAAIQIGGLHADRDLLIGWAAKGLSFVQNSLVDSDGLVRDALYLDTAANQWKIRADKWTYNTGYLIYGYSLLYQLTGSQSALALAASTASAAINHNSALFDQNVPNASVRYWNDDTFFVSYLVEGLSEYFKISSDANVKQEILRQALYAHDYVRDPADGLYWRNWRLYKINTATTQAGNSLMNTNFSLSPDLSERSTANTSLYPKSLLSNSSTAQLYLFITGIH